MITLYSEVNNLKCLTALTSLTLHGNPLEQKHNYRKHILSVLPQDRLILTYRGFERPLLTFLL